MDLQKMEEKEAAKRKKLQKDIDEAERHRQEEEARSRLQIEQTMALMEQKQAQAWEYTEMMCAMPERESQELRAMFDRLKEAWRQAIERAVVEQAQRMKLEQEKLEELKGLVAHRSMASVKFFEAWPQ
jgi:hypothetical protein